MSVVPPVTLVDANFLISAISNRTPQDDELRITHFFSRVQSSKGRIVIPMPALAEFLVKADGSGLTAVEQLERKAFIAIAPFDKAAAYECALLDAAALGRGNKRDGSRSAWQKIKIDRQIIAIGKAHGARLVISGDDGVRATAQRVGMNVSTIAELELPPGALQMQIPELE